MRKEEKEIESEKPETAYKQAIHNMLDRMKLEKIKLVYNFTLLLHTEE